MPDQPEWLCRDLFPAEVMMPDGRVFRDCRVFITTRRVLAYQVNDGIERIVDEPLQVEGSVGVSRSPLVGRDRIEAVVPGGTVFVNRGRGCGCGSTLKALGRPAEWGRW